MTERERANSAGGFPISTMEQLMAYRVSTNSDANAGQVCFLSQTLVASAGEASSRTAILASVQSSKQDIVNTFVAISQNLTETRTALTAYNEKINGWEREWLAYVSGLGPNQIGNAFTASGETVRKRAALDAEPGRVCTTRATAGEHVLNITSRSLQLIDLYVRSD